MLSGELTSFLEKRTASSDYIPVPGAEFDVARLAIEPHLQTDEIDVARTYFRGLRPSQRRTLATYIAANAPDEFKSDGAADWAEHLAEASDDQLGAFLDWNAAHTVAVNADPAVQTEIAVRRNRYKQLLQHAIIRRKLPDTAEGAIDRADLVPIVIGDVFSTELRSMNGFHVPQTGVVVLKQTASAATFEHEMNHAALGKLPSIFNEAFTTHIQAVLHTGAPDVLNPYDRADNNQSMVTQRALSAAVLSGGLDTVPASEGIASYCENDAAGPVTNALRDRLRASYRGIDILKTIDHWYAYNFVASWEECPDIPIAELAEEQDEMGDMFATACLAALAATLRGDSIQKTAGLLRHDAASLGYRKPMSSELSSISGHRPQGLAKLGACFERAAVMLEKDALLPDSSLALVAGTAF